MKLFFFFLVFIFATRFSFSQTLNIQINGIRNTSGNIRLAFYNTSQSFDDEKPMFIRKTAKKDLRNESMTISYTDLKPGIYGIAILDDENANDKMDYGLILPKEGFGFSDYYHTSMTRPKFDKFDFILGTATKTVSIKVRYL